MKKNEAFSADYRSPLGRLHVSGQGSSISGISMSAAGRLPAGQAGKAGKLPAPVRLALDKYFKGSTHPPRGRFLLKGTPFQTKVWNTLSSIPWGESISYGELARRIKRPKAVRAVANAVGSNPVAILIPCHRVVGSDGSLTGYAYGLKKKAWLLNHEKMDRG